MEPFLEEALTARGVFPDLATARRRVECFDALGGGQGYRWQDGGVSSALVLRNYIERPGGFMDRMQPIRRNQISIVAHSFGGLVSRYYLEQLGGAPRVRTLTQLGTPNLGVWMGNFITLCRYLPVPLVPAACSLFFDTQCLRDMAFDSEFLARLNGGFIAPPTDYFAIAGTGNESLLYVDEINQPNDCIVALGSAGFGLPLMSRRLIHTRLSSVLCASVESLVHDRPADLCESDRAHSFCDVLGHLDPAFRGAVGHATAALTPDALVAPQTGIAFGTLDAGAIAMHDIEIDPSLAEARFAVAYLSEGDAPRLRLTLRDPDGTPIDGSGPGITYGAGEVLIAGLTFDVYRAQLPRAGRWTAHIEAVAAPPEGVPYTFITFLQSTAGLLASVTPPFGLEGEPFTLSAQLMDGGNAIAADVSVTVTDPRRGTQQLVLHDTGGDRRYRATFNDTDTCGTYRFHFAAVTQSENICVCELKVIGKKKGLLYG